MRVLIAANPVSGGGRAAAVVPRLERALAALGITASTVFTTPDPRDDTLEMAIRDGPDAVVAVGGDGTLNRVVRAVILGAGVHERAPVVVFASLGTANVATRAFGLPRRPRDIAALVESGRVRAVDVGVVIRGGAPDAVFLLWCGAGLDGALIRRVAAGRAGDRGWRVMWRYALATIATFGTYEFPTIRVEAERTSGEFGAVIVANVGPIALGSVTRRADPSDGAADLVATGARSRAAWFLSGLLALAHLYDFCPGVRRSRETRVRLSSSVPVAVQVDGEPCGLLPVEIAIRPGALRLAAPA